ncbi:sulfatase [Haloferax denitrificans]|uniref:sulfatase n=1 Tax=Haloferax denitrificans TaxID=35745 RepID=UPI003C6F6E80
MKTLLITVDAWRASHASFMPNSTASRTPALESLAERGAVFTQAVSHGPATPYAFPALLTSTYPLDFGGYERIREDRTLLSERLADAGYSCTGIHANPWLGERYGYARGYETYRDVGAFSSPTLDSAREFLIDRFGLDHPVYRAAQYLFRFGSAPLYRLRGGADEVSLARRALADAPADSFVWVHLLDPHAPYAPPKRHREAVGVRLGRSSATQLTTRAQHSPDSLSERERESVHRLYDASVRHADERVGAILSAVGDDALVVVTADHGEALFEHGQVGHEPALYDELVHVPLLVRPPASELAGPLVVDTQVRHIDIAPTVLDYAGVDAPPSFRGQSLRPAIEGRAIPELPAVTEVASTRQTPGRIDESALQIGVRLPTHKLVSRGDELYGFDLRTDPGELAPIPNPEGADWRPLYRQLRERRDAIDFTGAVAAERDATVEERLRELGYLD